MNLLALLLIIISAVLIYFYYRNTNPPITNSLKWLLGILRFIFFAIVIMLIFNPTLHITRSKKVPPTTIILVDSSASMNQPLNIKDSKDLVALRKINDVSSFLNEQTIDHHTVPFSNGLTKDTTATDIFLSLKELQEDTQFNNISDVILISDGLQSNNESYSYVDELEFQVFPVMLGDQEAIIDVSLDDIIVNNPLYLNTETEVSCRISGLPDTTAFTLSVYDDLGNIIAEKPYSTKNYQREFSISFKPTIPGYHKLYAEIDLHDTNDYSTENNQREFLISVVKDKAQFTLISSSINWDITFIHRALMKNERFETTLIAQRENGYFHDNEEVSLEEKIADSDVLVLHNAGAFNFDAKTVQTIETYVTRGGNILYIGKIDPVLSPILPLQETRYKETIQATIIPTSIMQNYQTFAVNRDQSQESFWNSLPPITTYFYENKPRTEIIAQADIVSENPVIVFSTYMQGHVLYFSGYDFYRWKMREDIKKPWFDQFVMNIGQWLLNTDISQKFMCSSEKLSYMEGEPVEFSAHIFDEKLNLVKNQDIKLSIVTDDSTVAEKFFIENEHSYTCKTQELTHGKYSYSAETTLGRKIFKDEGEFLVEERSLEQSTHGIQKAYLQYIASKTNGKILVQDTDYNHLLDVQREVKVIKTTRDIELWKKWYLVVIAILLIATELFIRKKKGLL